LLPALSLDQRFAASAVPQSPEALARTSPLSYA
jgi:hypothetical protein